MILNYLNPVKKYRDLIDCLNDLKKFNRYKKIVFSLQKEGKLEKIGFSLDQTSNLYLGINLNPELLLYSETSQESVELKMVSEKMTKYTDFLTKEGIIDSVKVDYERIQTEEYYGYILKISYSFTKYSKKMLFHILTYFAITLSMIVAGVVYLIK